MVSASIMKKDAVLLGSVVFAPTVSFLGQPFSSLSAVSTTQPTKERIGRVSYLRPKMRSWNPHTVLFWDGKALAYHIAGLFNIQEGLSECQKAFCALARGTLSFGPSSAKHRVDANDFQGSSQP